MVALEDDVFAARFSLFHAEVAQETVQDFYVRIEFSLLAAALWWGA